MGERRPTFSQVLREARGDRPQSVVAKAVEVPQSTYSHWERGSRLPDSHGEGRQKLSRLSEELNIPVAQLLDALTQQRRRPRLPRSSHSLRPTSDFLQEQQTYLLQTMRPKLSKGQVADIWLISPATLPLAESPEVLETWAANLDWGANYKILWFLDLLDPAIQSQSLGQVANVLESLASRLSPRAKGQVVHYAAPVLSPLATNGSNSPDPDYERVLTYNTQLFESLRARRIRATQFRAVAALPFDMRRRLLAYSTRLGTLAVYCASDAVTRKSIPSPLVPPLAAFGLRSGDKIAFSILHDEAESLRVLVVELDSLFPL